VDPFSAARPVLPQGRYTLTLNPSIRSAHGRRLNGGHAAFSTTFLIGTGTYAPVLLRVSPRAGKTGVAPRQALVATFDESIDAASAAAAIRLEDRSTSPPELLPVRIKTARRGTVVVVAPAARSSWPRGADVALVVAGEGASTDASSALLKETGGHAFKRDVGPQWTADASSPTLFHSANGDYDEVAGEFTTTFHTRGKPRAAGR